MEVLKILIPMALMMGVVFIGFFIWATKDGQFDDLDTPSKRLLIDEDININGKHNNSERKEV
ncbi:MAG: cbb3-type cytochrome oxidase assembly protein CcoS [Halobacteriovoraceae bacterium]|nr:cbb3-type cytochrome oxidase assembly protein CcoS [Halobacteriovoraceae bacterium]